MPTPYITRDMENLLGTVSKVTPGTLVDRTQCQRTQHAHTHTIGEKRHTVHRGEC
jgi:hypothetical protein